jgi:formylglycine-generating enzyme required for sulfatase activity
MIGNVWEWVKGDVENGQVDGKSLPAPGFVQAVTGDGMPSQTDISAAHPDYDNDYFWLKISGQRGLARGGYWDNKTDAGKYAVYGVSPPAFSGPGIGFRCIK